MCQGLRPRDDPLHLHLPVPTAFPSFYGFETSYFILFKLPLLRTSTSHLVSGARAWQVCAFEKALETGCEATEDLNERQAMQAFIRLLGTMRSGRREISRSDWLTCSAPADAHTPEQATIFLSILNTILDNDEAINGLIEQIHDELDSATPYTQAMADLFDKVLDHKGEGKVRRPRVMALQKAIQIGCDASDDDEEKKTMSAFARLLGDIIGTRDQCTRLQWVSYVPSESNLTPTCEALLLEILEQILYNEESTEGLLSATAECE